MLSISDLLDQNIQNIKLNILVFGPNPEGEFEEKRVNDLRDKRIQIAEYLRERGHNVLFPENMINPNAPPVDKADIALMELMLMKKYDLIISLVDTPGTNAEVAVISLKPEFARKSTIFIFEEFMNGAVYAFCKLANKIGAELTEFTYPADLVECHLLTKVAEKVNAIQTASFLDN